MARCARWTRPLGAIAASEMIIQATMPPVLRPGRTAEERHEYQLHAPCTV